MLQEKKLTTGQYYHQAKALLGEKAPPPKKWRMSKVLHELHEECRLKRYVEMTFLPFSGTHDPTPDHVLNSFRAFPMERYSPAKIYNVEATWVWKYLRDVFGGEKEGPLFTHLLNMLSFQLQYPACRSERLTCLVSEGQGTGKGHWYKLMVFLLSRAYCSFFDNLDGYMTRFNMAHSRLCLFVDDISSNSVSSTRRLYSRCTASTQSYENKGEPTFTIREYSNLYLTGNEAAILHCGANDRRQQILEASNKYQQDRPFFRKLNEEFLNLDVAHAWFHFLKNRDIGNWHPSSNPPSSAKGKTLEACMVRAHSFLNEAFCSDSWLLSGIPENAHWCRWTMKYTTGRYDRGVNKGKRYIRIEHKRFFLLYKNYVRANFPSSKVRNIDTFLKETGNVGVPKHPKRLTLNGKKYHVVDLVFENFKTGFEKLYPDMEANTWDSEEDFIAFEKMLLKKQGLYDN
jgi:hypothetical protein